MVTTVKTLAILINNLYLNKMASNKTYRQQSAGSLGLLQNCPTCVITNPSYKMQYCSGGSFFYVDGVDAFSGTTPILNNTSYNVGDVLWVTPSQTGNRTCATVIAVNQTTPGTQFFDTLSGPWSQCSQCYTP
jgi:hypothetical protein